MTNYERIRAMSIEEMAKVIDITIDGICKNFQECVTKSESEAVTEDDCNACMIRWLKEEAK